MLIVDLFSNFEKEFLNVNGTYEHRVSKTCETREFKSF